MWTCILSNRTNMHMHMLASDKALLSIASSTDSHHSSVQGESDSEPEGLINTLSSNLDSIFSSDSSDAESDADDETFEKSANKPVFLTSKGPIHIHAGQSPYCLTSCCGRKLVAHFHLYSCTHPSFISPPTIAWFGDISLFDILVIFSTFHFVICKDDLLYVSDII